MMDIGEVLGRISLFVSIGSVLYFVMRANRKSGSFRDSASIFFYGFILMLFLPIISGMHTNGLWGTATIVFSIIAMLTACFLKLSFVQKRRTCKK